MIGHICLNSKFLTATALDYLQILRRINLYKHLTKNDKNLTCKQEEERFLNESVLAYLLSSFRILRFFAICF